MKLFKLCLVCLLGIRLITGCSTATEGNTGGKDKSSSGSLHKDSIYNAKHLNINVLIDLSNRINPQSNKLNPSQVVRDKAIIKAFCDALKKNVSTNGAFNAKSKMKVFFHPQPQNDAIAQIAQGLSAIFKSGTSSESVKENKKLYATVDSNFACGLRSLYDLALEDTQFPGSNIWRFMRDDVKSQCIEDDKAFRNILVILSDGYMYYSKELTRESNRYTYIERNFDHFRRFRNSIFLQAEFDQQNYGFIAANSGLENLEIILLEVSPAAEFPQDFDIIKRYWSKWFFEMGIKHFEIYKTDLPVNTIRLINNFLNST